jgi:hypothetical protein
MPFKLWTPFSWVSLIPNGIGQVKPNHYLEMLKAAWQNRDQLPFAWRILTGGVCDGCALGTTGMRDFTMKGVHLCMVRLNLLRLNTAPASNFDLLKNVASLNKKNAAELRELGRLPYPAWRKRATRVLRASVGNMLTTSSLINSPDGTEPLGVLFDFARPDQ